MNMGIESKATNPAEAQAEKEVDAGSVSSQSPDKAPAYFRRYDTSSWPNQQAWEAEHAEEMEREMGIVRKDLEKYGKTQPDETTRWQAMARIQARQEGERLVESGRMDKLIDRAIDEYLKQKFRKIEGIDMQKFVDEHGAELRQAVFDRLRQQPVNPDDYSKTTSDYLTGIVSNWVYTKATQVKNS